MAFSALWSADGLSQRELCARVGMMEPTTAIALRSRDLRSREKAGLVVRMRGEGDRREMRVLLPAKAKRLRNEFLAGALGITDEAEAGIAARDCPNSAALSRRMTANLDRDRAVISPNAVVIAVSTAFSRTTAHVV